MREKYPKVYAEKLLFLKEEELGGEGGDYDGINAYTPRSGYDKDEVFQYDEATRKIIADLWSRVKVAASNAH